MKVPGNNPGERKGSVTTMRVSVVSMRRLKILVTPEEMASGGRDVIADLIAAACRQTGFDPGDSRLLIETMPQRSGDFSICVTRLPGRRSGRGRDFSRERRREKTEPYIFVFHSLDDALSAGACILRHPEVLLTELNLFYRRDRWYLSFAPVIAGLDGYRLDCLLSCIGEFGQEEPGGTLRELRLLENGQCIASGSEAERLFALMVQAEAPSRRDRTAAGKSRAPKT